VDFELLDHFFESRSFTCRRWCGLWHPGSSLPFHQATRSPFHGGSCHRCIEGVSIENQFLIAKVAVSDCSLCLGLFPLFPKSFYSQHPQKDFDLISLAPTPGCIGVACRRAFAQTDTMLADRCRGTGADSLEQTRFLCEHGVDLDRTDAEGRSALIWCIMSSNATGIEILHQFGADLDQATQRYHSPAAAATEINFDGEGETCLQTLVRLGASFGPFSYRALRKILPRA
jgi:hypothetical protein